MTTSTIDIAGLEGERVTLTSEQLDDLDARVEGRLLQAGDDGWRKGRRVCRGTE